MNKTGNIIGVGLGPGEPELITLKGYKALKEADVIFYPASDLSDNQQVSFSARILGALDLNVACGPLLIPMSGKNRKENYKAAFVCIQKEYVKGKTVAIVSEGDLLFYSTFGYLLKLIQEHKMNYELIPGIPAFIASGACSKRPIVEGNETLKVIARPSGFDEIEVALKNNSRVVVMKMSVLDNWYSFLAQGKRAFFYIERAGTAQQYSTSNYKDLEFRKIPYFSLLIIYG